MLRQLRNDCQGYLLALEATVLSGVKIFLVRHIWCLFITIKKSFSTVWNRICLFWWTLCKNCLLYASQTWEFSLGNGYSRWLKFKTISYKLHKHEAFHVYVTRNDNEGFLPLKVICYKFQKHEAFQLCVS